MYKQNFRKTENQVCGQCRGEGIKWTGKEWDCCSFCSGTGLVEVIKETVVTIRPKYPKTIKTPGQ